MIFAVIGVGICQVIFFAGLARLLTTYFERKQEQIEARINDELVKLVAGEPCQTAAVLNAAGRVIGSEAGRSAKASLMADLSHLKRAENTAAADQQLALLQDSSPGIGGILERMGPGKRSKMLSNPLVQMAMSALLGGTAGAGGTPGNGNNGGSTSQGSVRDRLKKGG